VAGAVLWWYSNGKPSVQQIVEAVTRPVFGSKAAVKETEHNRVEVEALTEQSETHVDMLRAGMSLRQVRDLLGEPNAIETAKYEKGKPEVVRWTYLAAHRVLVFEDGRVVSIAVR
jgi:tRNA(Glu) U13 pseudouridine synthase TruD